MSYNLFAFFELRSSDESREAFLERMVQARATELLFKHEVDSNIGVLRFFHIRTALDLLIFCERWSLISTVVAVILGISLSFSGGAFWYAWPVLSLAIVLLLGCRLMYASYYRTTIEQRMLYDRRRYNYRYGLFKVDRRRIERFCALFDAYERQVLDRRRDSEVDQSNEQQEHDTAFGLLAEELQTEFAALMQLSANGIDYHDKQPGVARPTWDQAFAQSLGEVEVYCRWPYVHERLQEQQAEVVASVK